MPTMMRPRGKATRRVERTVGAAGGHAAGRPGGRRVHSSRAHVAPPDDHARNPMSRFTDTLNAQVANEFGASQQYVAIAVYYDAETLPQLAAHFYRQAVEERNHAMMLVQYLLDAGEEPRIPGIAGAAHDVRERRGAGGARARAGAQGHRADHGALADRARGRERPGRAVHALVPQGAARGDVEHDRAPADGGTGGRLEHPPRRGPAGADERGRRRRGPHRAGSRRRAL